jgi:hypothetical protein
MRGNHLQIVVVCTLLAFMMAGCGRQTPTRYHQAEEIAPVHFSQTSRSGIWQSNDLSISYTIDSRTPLFSLSGTLELNPSLVMFYPVVDSLFLRIHFLDADGKILSTSPINVSYSYRTYAVRKSSFTFTKEISGQAEAFTFSYSGTFSDYEEKYPNTTFIQYSPAQCPCRQ